MNEHLHGYRFTALGCTGRIRIATVSRADADHAVAMAVRWLRACEAKLSRFQPTSLVSALNHGASVPRDADLCAVLAAGADATQRSAGRLSLLAAPLWQLWHAPTRHVWPDFVEIAAAKARCGQLSIGDAIQLQGDGAQLDLGVVGKEWCVDRLVDQLAAAGCHDVLVELGGDCAARGQQPGRAGWVVLLPGTAAAVVLRNEALATSGHGTRGRLLAGRWVSHLIDAVSGQPASGVVRSATVLAPDCLTAGIHASDLCLLDDVTPITCAARSGGLPYWLRSASDDVHSDPRFLVRVHPVSATSERMSA